MARLRPFSAFLEQLSHLDRDAFLAQVTAPCLVFNGAEEGGLPELFTTLVAGGAPTGDTPCVNLKPGSLLAAFSQQWVVPVAKEEGTNAFGMMITIGRAANNDVVVPDSRVSKFHAYFRQEGDAWLLTDAGSTNGTQVDGLEVAEGERVRVRAGATVQLSGALRFTFLPPEDLFELVHYSAAVTGAA